MLDTTETATASSGAPGEEAQMTGHFAGILCGTVAGALGTLDLLRADISRTAEAMDEGGKASGWAAVIGLVTDALSEPHLDLEQCLGASAAVRMPELATGGPDAALLGACAAFLAASDLADAVDGKPRPVADDEINGAARGYEAALRRLAKCPPPRTPAGAIAQGRAALAALDRFSRQEIEEQPFAVTFALGALRAFVGRV